MFKCLILNSSNILLAFIFKCTSVFLYWKQNPCKKQQLSRPYYLIKLIADVFSPTCNKVQKYNLVNWENDDRLNELPGIPKTMKTHIL